MINFVNRLAPSGANKWLAKVESDLIKKAIVLPERVMTILSI